MAGQAANLGFNPGSLFQLPTDRLRQLAGDHRQPVARSPEAGPFALARGCASTKVVAWSDFAFLPPRFQTIYGFRHRDRSLGPVYGSKVCTHCKCAYSLFV